MQILKATLLRHAMRQLMALLFVTGIADGYTCTAQSSHQIFEHLTTENGLSSDKVTEIIQDHEGFYWIATVNGLNRFDGSSFKIFTHHKEDSTSIAHNQCTDLLEDLHGDIWVSTFYGLCRYIKSKGHFQTISLPNVSGIPEKGNTINELALDQEGNVWIGGFGLWKYDIKNDSITFFRKENMDPSLLRLFHAVKHLTYDHSNNGLWFSTGFETIFFSIRDLQFYHKEFNPQHWKIFDVAEGYEMTLDLRGRVWFRDRQSQSLAYFESESNRITITDKKILLGVKRITADEKNRIWIFYWTAESEIFEPESGVTDKSFFSGRHRLSDISPINANLFIDPKSNYWIASNEGISIYNEANQFYKLHDVSTDPNIPDNAPLKINAIAQSEPGYVWLATNTGLYQYNLVTGENHYVHVITPIPKISAILADGDKLWIGVHNQLIGIDILSKAILYRKVLGSGVYFIRKGNEEDLWIGLWSGGLFRLHTGTGNLHHFLKDTANPETIISNALVTGYADDHTFWVGYNAGAGFSSYSLQTDAWSHFHPEEENVSNLSVGTVTVITPTEEGQMWLGTHGGGIFRFDPAGIRFKNFDQNDGLHSNFINSIVPDAHGQLWISTADGMNYMNTATHRIRSLNIDLVFPDNDFAPNGIEGLEGKLYFFRNHEIVEVDPARYNPDHTFPQLVISSFSIFDKEKALPRNQERINLSHRENYFSFGYSAIKTHQLKKATYAYLLEGFDKDWITTGRPYTSYTNVPEGNYTFKVRVTNDEGEWGEPLLNIPIYIQPPFWRTWWFISLCVVLVISGIYLFYRYRIQQMKKLFAVRTKISQDLHDDIGASMSSIHFTSTIAGQEVVHNPQKAQELLKQINQNSRQVIENISDIVWANQTHQPENSSLAGRIKNYGYDLLSPNNIECHYWIDAQVEKKLSNPEARRNILLIIKEAMNNIAKYSKADQAEVRVALNGAHLLVDISDNGDGFIWSDTTIGNGLKNMKKRTDSLDGSFRLESSPGKGTRIHCRIPLPNISDR